MRKVLLTTSLLAMVANSTMAAMPYFHEGSASQTQVSESKSGGGWFSRLWKSEPKNEEPKFFYQPTEPKPSATERVTSALTDNAAIRTARNWVTPNSDTPKPSAVSVNQTPVKPTAELMVSVAQISEGKGDVAAAREMYLKALAANPKNVNTLRELGHFEDRQNQLADAERYYGQAAQIEPQNPTVLNDLALCLARQGKLAPSAQVLERAIQLAPTKPLYRNNMATVLMELGEQHLAMQHLMAVHPQPAAYYNMGHLLEKGGQNEAAMAHYAEALRLDPTMKHAEQALAKGAPKPPANVPQTAMAPTTNATNASLPPIKVPEVNWPSESIAPAATPGMKKEPEFGPRLLPPVE